MKTKRLLAVSAAAICIVFRASLHAAALAYTATDLGTLGGSSSRAFGINALGQVTGFSDTAGGDSRGFVWTGTALIALPTLGGPGSGGNSINNSGQVAGTSSYDNIHSGHATRWTGTTPTDLGTLGQFQNIGSQGRGINASGQVAGFSNIDGGGTNHAVRWTGTSMEDLGTIGGGTTSYGYAINTAGKVAGATDIGGGIFHAVIWTGTTPTELATLGSTSGAYAINDAGQAAGTSGSHAVRWTGIAPTDLGALTGTHSDGFGINNFGDVVGVFFVAGIDLPDSYGAFLYSGNTMYDLNALLVPGSGVRINDAQAINDAGQIAATGVIGGRTHAILLTPTPEPASAVLLLGGAAMLGLLRRR